jgi:hypothetical protein
MYGHFNVIYIILPLQNIIVLAYTMLHSNEALYCSLFWKITLQSPLILVIHEAYIRTTTRSTLCSHGDYP